MIKYLLIFFIATISYAQEPDLTKSVFAVDTGVSRATAFLLQTNNKQYLVTNWHLCRTAIKGKISVSSSHYKGEAEVKVLYEFPLTDLCFMEPVKGEPITEAITYFPGKRVIIRAYKSKTEAVTLDGMYRNDSLNETADYPIESTGGCLPGFKLITQEIPNYCLRSIPLGDTDIKIGPGASGSPVVNTSGHLIGVVQSYRYKDHTAGFIKLEDVQKVLKEIK